MLVFLSASFTVTTLRLADNVMCAVVEIGLVRSTIALSMLTELYGSTVICFVAVDTYPLLSVTVNSKRTSPLSKTSPKGIKFVSDETFFEGLQRSVSGKVG